MTPRTKEASEKIKAQTRKKILKAGLKVFALKGYYAAKISDIAQEAGLSHGLVYHYFKSKTKIIVELVSYAFDQSINVTRQASNVSGSAWEKIENITKMLYENAIRSESPYYFYLIIQAQLQGKGIPEVATLLQRRSVEYNEILIPLLIEAQQEGRVIQQDPLKLSLSFWALVQGLALSALWSPAGFEITNQNIILNLLKR